MINEERVVEVLSQSDSVEPLLDKYVEDLYSKDPMQLNGLLQGVNTVEFVEDLKNEGVSQEGIEQFFFHVILACSKSGVSLPRYGYMDLVSFAAKHGLIKNLSNS